jgi:hypothetical protein
MIAVAELAPELLLTGGVIHTVSERGTVSALAVKDGRIVWVGAAESAAAVAGPRTRTVDVRGLTVLPGFVDSHNHMLKTGLDLGKVQLGDVTTLDQLLAAVAARADALPDGEWVVASASWHEAGLAEKRLPTREELDAAAPRHPVYIPRGGHTAVTNSMGLALAGIDEGAKDPPGGAFIRDPRSRRLTGQLFETPAMNLVAALIPPPSFEEKVAALRRAQQLYHAAGITALRDPGLIRLPGLDAEDFRAYVALWKAGGLTLRVTGMVGVPPAADPEESVAALTGSALGSGFGDEWLRVGAIKLMTDGGVETAHLRSPYATDATFTGVRVLEPDYFLALLSATRRLGWAVGVHCVGDAAIEMVTRTFEAIHREAPLTDEGWAVEHAILATPEQSRRLRDLGVFITAQSVHLWKLGQNMVKHWGPERAHAAYPIRTWLDLGLRVAGGTDANVCPHDQLLTLYVDVTRETEQAGALGPSEAIPAEAALRSHTRVSADCLGIGAWAGSLEPGKVADFIIASDDPLAAPPGRLRQTRVLTTVTGGQVVHRQDDSPL